MIREEAARAAAQLFEVAKMKEGELLVVGCSSSEIGAEKIGTHSSAEIGQAVFEGIKGELDRQGVFLAAQCCEHLNRALILERAAAEKYGYDFTRLSLKKNKAGSIYAVSYRSHNAIMSYSPIFDAMVEGMESVVQKDNYKLKVITFYEKRDNLEHYLGDLRTTDCVGIILFGTEMREEMVRPFLKLPFPVVILDAYFENLDCNYVVPNNRQGAYLATDYLISLRMKQPGYLQSAYPLRNFSERLEGFYHAVHDNGMSRSRCIIHQLSPTIDGAMADMLAIIDRGDTLADCYFADNDLIAIGTIKALRLRGYKVPEQVAIVGFDNISEGRIIDPSLTSISIPRHYMGQVAARELLSQINDPRQHTCKIEVSANLVKRFSV